MGGDYFSDDNISWIRSTASFLEMSEITVPNNWWHVVEALFFFFFSGLGKDSICGK